MIKKLLIIVFLSLSFFSLTLSTTKASGETPESTKVRVAIYENPPKIFTENGEAKGFWADILNYVALNENWEIEYVNGTFNEGLEKVKVSEVDMLVDVAYSGERSRIYRFTNETAFINWAGVYSRPDLQVNSFADLKGKRIAVLNGDIHFVGPLGLNALMDAFGYTAEYQKLSSYGDTMKAVSEGKADIAIVNRIFGTFSEANYNVKRTNIVFNPIELKFAISKDSEISEYLQTTLDENLKILKDDSESIYYKSIIENLEGVVRTVEVTPDWIKPALVVFGVVMVVVIILFLISKRYQFLLEKTVAEKTAELKNSEGNLREKLRQVETLMKATVDREVKMAELKKDLDDKNTNQTERSL